MVKNIFVGNLPYTASEDDIQELFSAYGEVQSVRLIMDRETQRPRGFGFVRMEAEAADKAIKALDGHQMGGRPLRVNEAQDNRDREGGRR